MIVVDTGALVGLFDPKDRAHAWCVETLESIDEPLSTTIPVLTEAFYMLGSGRGAANVIEFIRRGGMRVWFFDEAALARAFGLIDEYRAREIDFAAASLLVAAEVQKTRKIFTIDRRDFLACRIRIGHRMVRPQLVGM